MNRSKRAAPKETLKAMRKEVRKAKESPASLSKKSTPKKSALKSLLAKKHKKPLKTSKRTAPGTAEDSIPQHVHTEGQRWMKTLVKQNVLKGKLLTKQAAKR